MPKQNVSINFSQGLNTKTDPWQVPIGQFEELVNSIFQKGGLLQKRNGYELLSATSPATSYLTTLNGNLTVIGSTVSAFSSSLDKWITKGTLQPCSLSTLPLIRNNLNQTYADSTVANGLVLTAYTQTNQSNTAITTQYLFVVADSTTGQNIVEPSTIPVLAGGTITGSSKVFVVGNYFLIVSPVNVSGTTFLQYVSIPISNPVNTNNTANTSPAQNVTAENYVPLGTAPGWDGITINSASNNVLVIAYNSTTTAQGIHVASLTSQLIAANSASTVISQFNNAVYKADQVSVCVDTSSSTDIFYISFWNPSTSNGYTAAVSLGLFTIHQVFTPQEIITSQPVVNLASGAINGQAIIFSEVTNTYGYDSSITTNFIDAVTVSSTGTVGTPYIAVRSVGLASKAFVQDGLIYFMSTYNNPTTTLNPPINLQSFQPSYFLINGSTTTATAPIVVAKLAYQNGGGLLTLGLPGVANVNGINSIAYLYKDLVQAVTTQNQPNQSVTAGIYSQTGINLVNFDVNTAEIDSAEIANNLHISGGYLAQYDGYLPVEHNFFVFPDSVEAAYTASSTETPTGTASLGSNVITISSATGVYPGMSISDTTNSTYIPAGTTILTVSGTTVTMSAVTTHAISGDTLSIHGNMTDQSGAENLYNYIATYEWTDNQGLPYRSQTSIPVTMTTGSGTGTTGIAIINIPTLRLTAKIANPVKIVLYRWGTGNQVYQQVTSIFSPILNNPSVDYVTFVDTLPDTAIVGNNILYTTGGIPSDTNAPASSIIALFNQSLCLVPSESPNTIWISQTVLPGTPIEMSQSLQINVASNQGTEGSLGPITALYPMDDKLLIFFQNGIYYINGSPPPATGATSSGCSLGNYSQPIFITSIVGCTNQQSIVLTQDGVMFQSDKGIWLLSRGLSPSYIGAPVEDFNQFTVNSAKVIPETNYVLFTLDTDQFLMYDFYYSQWGSFEGVSALSSCIYQGLHTVVDPYGRILQEKENFYMDVDSPVLMKFTTSWINIASLQGYERFYDFYILAKYLSPHKLLCSVAYDYNESILNQKLIAPQNFSSATPGPFGVPTPYGSPGNREQWRIHAKQQLCQSFQLSVQEIYDPSFGVAPGAGFTMSGLTAEVMIKKGTRPIKGGNAAGMS